MTDGKGLRWFTSSNGALTVCCLLLCLSTAVTRPVGRGHRRLVQDGTSVANPAAVDQGQHQAPAVRASAGQQNEDNSAAIKNDFKRADSCIAGGLGSPTAKTSTPDAASRLWGWSPMFNSSCAFKNDQGRALWYTDFVPGNWLHTPACSDEPFPADSATDGTFKSWGWERDGSLCAFKDDQQQPYPISRDLYTNMLAFDEAPMCTEDPEPTPDNSRPDEYGCLWGWQVSRNCAFKHDNDEPRYYKGYKRTCNLQASQERSIRFKKDPDGYIKTWYAGRKVGAAEESEAKPVYDTSAIAAPVPVAHNRNLTVNEGGNITDLMDWSQAVWMNHPEPQSNPDAAMADKANNIDMADTADKANKADKAATGDSADKANKTDTADKANKTDTVDKANNKADTADKANKADNAVNAGTADEVDKAGKAAADAGGPAVSAGQKLSIESEGAQAHDFMQATFFNPPGQDSTVPAQAGDSQGRRHLAGNDGIPANNVVEDKRFPKGDPRSNQDAQQGQRCSTVDPPGHGTASLFADNPCLFEASTQKINIASQADVVFRKPVAGSSVDVTPPMKFGGKDGRRRPRMSMIKVAQDSLESGNAHISVGHRAFQEAEPYMLGKSEQRRHLLASVAVANVVAVASHNSDGHNAAVATATALSSGNHSAVAEAYAANNSSANAEAVADGKNAVAIANATKGNCVLSVVVHNNKVSWHCVESASSTSPAPTPHGNATADKPASDGAGTNSLGQQWHEAARCTSTPDQATSVQDSESRLWGYEDKLAQPCAYRAVDGTPVFYPGFAPLKWDTTPACIEAPTATNSMMDSAGRLWGWNQDKEENCAFKDASTGDPVYIPSAAVPEPDKQTAGPEVSPSAAGRSVNAPDPSNSTVNAAPSGNITASDKKYDAVPGRMEVIDNPAIQSAADAQAHTVTRSLAPNATSAEVALASAQAAIIYQMASEATTAQTSTDNIVKISQAEDPAANTNSIPQVLLGMVSSLKGDKQAS